MRFKGKYEHTLDGKGRTSVPSRHREVFAALGETDADGERAREESVVVTRSNDGCLLCYPRSTWVGLEEMVAKLPPLSARAKALKRLLIAHAVECAIDKHGRILIPQSLREYAGLERDVIWVGQVGNCEIWNPESWEAAVSDSMSDPETLAAALEDLQSFG